jgi:hypothetical protein
LRSLRCRLPHATQRNGSPNQLELEHPTNPLPNSNGRRPAPRRYPPPAPAAARRGLRPHRQPHSGRVRPRCVALTTCASLPPCASSVPPRRLLFRSPRAAPNSPSTIHCNMEFSLYLLVTTRFIYSYICLSVSIRMGRSSQLLLRHLPSVSLVCQHQDGSTPSSLSSENENILCI